jgi:hypothetical protein
LIEGVLAGRPIERLVLLVDGEPVGELDAVVCTGCGKSARKRCRNAAAVRASRLRWISR